MKISAKELQKKPIFWSRLGFPYDPPMSDANGNPLVFDTDLSKYLAYHKQFLDCGVQIHTGLLHSGWVGIDRYDYSLTDKVLDSIMSLSDDLLYMARVKLNPPLEWCRQNPEELFLYENAPRTAAEISALIGTLKQDILGYDSERGYYAPGTLIDPRPNVDGVVGMQSISSKAWLADAGRALEKLLRHIAEKPYADRIIGYQVCFGPSGENMIWGRQSYRCGDYGINALKSFYDFGIQKYKSHKALCNMWGKTALSGDSVILPSPLSRYGEGVNNRLSDLFRDASRDRLIIDYDEFLSDSVSGALDHFAGLVKNFDPDKLTGVFYGYIFEMQNAHYAGHLAIDRLLCSPNIDFFAAPMSYRHRQDGNTGGEMTAVHSINRRKQWVDETDLRTFLAAERSASCKSFSRAGTYQSLWREVCKKLAHGSGFWWMDLGGGWFDDAGILSEIKKMTAFMTETAELPHCSTSDILIVADEKDYYTHKRNSSLQRGCRLDLISKIHKSGALADIYRLTDLDTLDLSAYKLIVFASAFRLSKAELDRLPFREDATLLFSYTSGICADGTVSLQNTERLTGFALKEVPCEGPLPAITLTDGSSLGKRSEKGRTYVLSLDPALSAQAVKEIVKDAGCHLYIDGNDTVVYGDNRLLFVAAKDGYNGTLRLPHPATDLFTGEALPPETPLSLPPLGFRVLVYN